MRAVFAVIALFSFPAWAAQRTFVASNGNDANPCTRDMPCRSFAVAIALTNANGEVVAIDSAGYGSLTVMKAVTIVAPLGVHAGISVFSGDGVTISAASNDVVVLRNLYINSQGGLNGITLNSAASLHIEHCVVNGFASNNINLVPTTLATVMISDTVSRQSVDGSGIYAGSTAGAGGPAAVSIDHCLLALNGGDGVAADWATVTIRDTTAAQNRYEGFEARGSGGTTKMNIESSVASTNGYDGIRVRNGQVTAHNTTSHGNINNGFLADLGTAKLAIDHCIASSNDQGIFSEGGADISVSNSTMADNSNSGAAVYGGTYTTSMLRLTRNTITRNPVGIYQGNVSTVQSLGDNLVKGNPTADVQGTITVVGGT